METTAVRDCPGGKDRGREQRAQRIVEELLLRCGITPHLCGFDPLSNLIRMAAERDRSRGTGPLSDLQPMLGLLFRACNPEHAMRDAIGVGFLGSDEIHTTLFPFSDRPCSAEFVCTLAELVRDRMAQNGTAAKNSTG